MDYISWDNSVARKIIEQRLAQHSLLYEETLDSNAKIAVETLQDVKDRIIKEMCDRAKNAEKQASKPTLGREYVYNDINNMLISISGLLELMHERVSSIIVDFNKLKK